MLLKVPWVPLNSNGGGGGADASTASPAPLSSNAMLRVPSVRLGEYAVLVLERIQVATSATDADVLSDIAAQSCLHVFLLVPARRRESILRAKQLSQEEANFRHNDAGGDRVQVPQFSRYFTSFGKEAEKDCALSVAEPSASSRRDDGIVIQLVLRRVCGPWTHMSTQDRTDNTVDKAIPHPSLSSACASGSTGEDWLVDGTNTLDQWTLQEEYYEALPDPTLRSLLVAPYSSASHGNRQEERKDAFLHSCVVNKDFVRVRLPSDKEGEVRHGTNGRVFSSVSLLNSGTEGNENFQHFAGWRWVNRLVLPLPWSEALTNASNYVALQVVGQSKSSCNTQGNACSGEHWGCGLVPPEQVEVGSMLKYSQKKIDWAMTFERAAIWNRHVLRYFHHHIFFQQQLGRSRECKSTPLSCQQYTPTKGLSGESGAVRGHVPSHGMDPNILIQRCNEERNNQVKGVRIVENLHPCTEKTMLEETLMDLLVLWRSFSGRSAGSAEGSVCVTGLSGQGGGKGGVTRHDKGSADTSTTAVIQECFCDRSYNTKAQAPRALLADSGVTSVQTGSVARKQAAGSNRGIQLCISVELLQHVCDCILFGLTVYTPCNSFGTPKAAARKLGAPSLESSHNVFGGEGTDGRGSIFRQIRLITGWASFSVARHAEERRAGSAVSSYQGLVASEPASSAVSQDSVTRTTGDFPIETGKHRSEAVSERFDINKGMGEGDLSHTFGFINGDTGRFAEGGRAGALHAAAQPNCLSGKQVASSVLGTCSCKSCAHVATKAYPQGYPTHVPADKNSILSGYNLLSVCLPALQPQCHHPLRLRRCGCSGYHRSNASAFVASLFQHVCEAYQVTTTAAGGVSGLGSGACGECVASTDNTSVPSLKAQLDWSGGPWRHQPYAGLDPNLYSGKMKGFEGQGAPDTGINTVLKDFAQHQLRQQLDRIRHGYLLPSHRLLKELNILPSCLHVWYYSYDPLPNDKKHRSFMEPYTKSSSKGFIFKAAKMLCDSLFAGRSKGKQPHDAGDLSMAAAARGADCGSGAKRETYPGNAPPVSFLSPPQAETSAGSNHPFSFGNNVGSSPNAAAHRGPAPYYSVCALYITAEDVILRAAPISRPVLNRFAKGGAKSYNKGQRGGMGPGWGCAMGGRNLVEDPPTTPSRDVASATKPCTSLSMASPIPSFGYVEGTGKHTRCNPETPMRGSHVRSNEAQLHSATASGPHWHNNENDGAQNTPGEAERFDGGHKRLPGAVTMAAGESSEDFEADNQEAHVEMLVLPRISIASLTKYCMNRATEGIISEHGTHKFTMKDVEARLLAIKSVAKAEAVAVEEGGATAPCLYALPHPVRTDVHCGMPTHTHASLQPCPRAVEASQHRSSHPLRSGAKEAGSEGAVKDHGGTQQHSAFALTHSSDQGHSASALGLCGALLQGQGLRFAYLPTLLKQMLSLPSMRWFDRFQRGILIDNRDTHSNGSSQAYPPSAFPPLMARHAQKVSAGGAKPDACCVLLKIESLCFQTFWLEFADEESLSFVYDLLNRPLQAREPLVRTLTRQVLAQDERPPLSGAAKGQMHSHFMVPHGIDATQATTMPGNASRCSVGTPPWSRQSFSLFSKSAPEPSAALVNRGGCRSPAAPLRGSDGRSKAERAEQLHQLHHMLPQHFWLASTPHLYYPVTGNRYVTSARRPWPMSVLALLACGVLPLPVAAATDPLPFAVSHTHHSTWTAHLLYTEDEAAAESGASAFGTAASATTLFFRHFLQNVAVAAAIQTLHWPEEEEEEERKKEEGVGDFTFQQNHAQEPTAGNGSGDDRADTGCRKGPPRRANSSASTDSCLSDLSTIDSAYEPLQILMSNDNDNAVRLMTEPADCTAAVVTPEANTLSPVHTTSVTDKGRRSPKRTHCCHHDDWKVGSVPFLSKPRSKASGDSGSDYHQHCDVHSIGGCALNSGMAFSAHRRAAPRLRDTWWLYDVTREYLRQSLDPRDWHITTFNHDHSAIPTYPATFVLPTCLGPALRDGLINGDHRVSRRMEAVTYVFAPTGGALVRSAQPAVARHLVNNYTLGTNANGSGGAVEHPSSSPLSGSTTAAVNNRRLYMGHTIRAAPFTNAFLNHSPFSGEYIGGSGGLINPRFNTMEHVLGSLSRAAGLSRQRVLALDLRSPQAALGNIIVGGGSMAWFDERVEYARLVNIYRVFDAYRALRVSVLEGPMLQAPGQHLSGLLQQSGNPPYLAMVAAAETACNSASLALGNRNNKDGGCVRGKHAQAAIPTVYSLSNHRDDSGSAPTGNNTPTTVKGYHDGKGTLLPTFSRPPFSSSGILLPHAACAESQSIPPSVAKAEGGRSSTADPPDVQPPHPHLHHQQYYPWLRAVHMLLNTAIFAARRVSGLPTDPLYPPAVSYNGAGANCFSHIVGHDFVSMRLSPDEPPTTAFPLKHTFDTKVEGGSVEQEPWNGATAAHSILPLASYIPEIQRALTHVVLLNCSDGWDRTSQVSALTQLLLDPYFRTVEGFCILLEKDFVAFGHPARRRATSIEGNRKALLTTTNTASPLAYESAVFSSYAEFPQSAPGDHRADGCARRAAPGAVRGSFLDNTGRDAAREQHAHAVKDDWEVLWKAQREEEDAAEETSIAELGTDQGGNPPSVPNVPDCSVHQGVAAARARGLFRATSNSKSGAPKAPATSMLFSSQEAAKQENSPILLQFFDAVWQLVRLYPNCFEFTGNFLRLLVDLIHSGLVSSFAVNCEADVKTEHAAEGCMSIGQWCALLLATTPHMPAGAAAFASLVSAAPKPLGFTGVGSVQKRRQRSWGSHLDSAGPYATHNGTCSCAAPSPGSSTQICNLLLSTMSNNLLQPGARMPCVSSSHESFSRISSMTTMSLHGARGRSWLLNPAEAAPRPSIAIERPNKGIRNDVKKPGYLDAEEYTRTVVVDEASDMHFVTHNSALGVDPVALPSRRGASKQDRLPKEERPAVFVPDVAPSIVPCCHPSAHPQMCSPCHPRRQRRVSPHVPSSKEAMGKEAPGGAPRRWFTRFDCSTQLRSPKRRNGDGAKTDAAQHRASFCRPSPSSTFRQPETCTRVQPVCDKYKRRGPSHMAGCRAGTCGAYSNFSLAEVVSEDVMDAEYNGGEEEATSMHSSDSGATEVDFSERLLPVSREAMLDSGFMNAHFSLSYNVHTVGPLVDAVPLARLSLWEDFFLRHTFWEERRVQLRSGRYWQPQPHQTLPSDCITSPPSPYIKVPDVFLSEGIKGVCDDDEIRIVGRGTRNNEPAAGVRRAAKRNGAICNPGCAALLGNPSLKSFLGKGVGRAPLRSPSPAGLQNHRRIDACSETPRRAGGTSMGFHVASDLDAANASENGDV